MQPIHINLIKSQFLEKKQKKKELITETKSAIRRKKLNGMQGWALVFIQPLKEPPY